MRQYAGGIYPSMSWSGFINEMFNLLERYG